MVALSVFLSFLLTLLLGFLTLITINYTVYSWENEKIADLTKQIKPSKNDILSKSNVNRNFSTFDFNKHHLGEKTNKLYEKALVLVVNKEYPDWLSKVLKELNYLKNNTWKGLLRISKYLIDLTKPIAGKSGEEVFKEKKRVQEIADTVDKVGENNENYQEIQENKEERGLVALEKTEKNDEKEKEFNFQDPSSLKDNPKDEDNISDDLATIGILNDDSKESSKTTTTKKENPTKQDEVYEKLEARILAKLKESGFEHYDIWLELGDFYVKFKEKEKAREIFALVLKHSEGKEREFARDKLIGL